MEQSKTLADQELTSPARQRNFVRCTRGVDGVPLKAEGITDENRRLGTTEKYVSKLSDDRREGHGGRELNFGEPWR